MLQGYCLTSTKWSNNKVHKQNVSLSRDEETWNETVRRLKEYKKQHGHTNVPYRYNDGRPPHLGTWVLYQRNHYRQYQNANYTANVITKEREAILESLGFEWKSGREDEFEEAWMSCFKDMKKFVKRYNTTKVNSSNSTSATTLRWADNQGRSYSGYIRNETSTITSRQMDLLSSIDFAWNLTNKTLHEEWIHEYFKLYWHHFEHNSTIISQSSGYNSDFDYWVEILKRDYNAGNFEQGKIDLLNYVDFNRTLTPVATWKDMYEQLLQYYERFGSMPPHMAQARTFLLFSFQGMSLEHGFVANNDNPTDLRNGRTNNNTTTTTSDVPPPFTPAMLEYLLHQVGQKEHRSGGFLKVDDDVTFGVSTTFGTRPTLGDPDGASLCTLY
ncbi:helicase domain protein [Nitzschia inconspicua]|uniref:Helicase domain protein n=1 Tax=Nitzschia inconspicua TaxID=303405 RepID=A0A9K3KDF8_9STRA|nr:helicase domain protein [Nitzschia inconspicua]